MWGVCKCMNEPRGFDCALGPSPASLIPARHIKETGDVVAACCLYTLPPGSSRLWWGESRPELGAVDHIWLGVVSPAAILPASTACCQGTVALHTPLLLVVYTSFRQSLRLSFSSLSSTSEENIFEPPPALYAPFALLSPCSLLPHLPFSSCYCFCLFFPNPLLQLFLFLPAFLLPLYFPWCWLPVFHPLSPLSFWTRKRAHQGLLRCAGSTGRFVCTSFFIISSCLACAFGNSLACACACAPALLCDCESVNPKSGRPRQCLLKHVHFHSHSIWVS